nr:hypothetical protein [Tanacetum cinerariifolium]
GQSLRVTLWGELDDISCLQELRADDSRVAPSKALFPINCSQPREGTLENLLIWTATFHCKVMIENFRTKRGGTTRHVVMKSAGK